MYIGNPSDLSEGVFDLEVWLGRMGREKVLDELEASKAGGEDEVGARGGGELARGR